jgi:hypothetical protein
MLLTDKPVSAQQSEMCSDMSKAPLGRKVIAINPGGVAVFAVLSKDNLKHFIEWAPLPKRAKKD